MNRGECDAGCVMYEISVGQSVVGEIPPRKKEGGGGNNGGGLFF